MKTSLWGAITLALLMGITRPHKLSAQAGKSAFDTSLQTATVMVRLADFFAIGGVGYDGTTSRSEIAYRRILEQPSVDAVSAFEQIYTTGGPVAKAYALLGIYRLAPARFKELYATLTDSTEEVRTMQGCIVSSERLSMVAKRIDHGYYDLKAIDKTKVQSHFGVPDKI